MLRRERHRVLGALAGAPLQEESPRCVHETGGTPDDNLLDTARMAYPSRRWIRSRNPWQRRNGSFISALSPDGNAVIVRIWPA